MKNRKPFLTVIPNRTKCKHSEKKSPDWKLLYAMLVLTAFAVLNFVMAVGARIGADWAFGW